MKKILCVALAAATIAAGCGLAGCGGTATVNYTLSDDGTHYIVSSVSGDKFALTEYEIPATYAAEDGGQTLPVTEIADSAFYQCASLYSVVIPDGVKTIGKMAFALTGLREVNIPDSVETIGYSAFGMCKQLETVTVPQSVTDLGVSAFMYCSKLERAEIYANITDLKRSTFENTLQTTGGSIYSDTSLTEVVLPSTLTKISVTALYGNMITDIYFTGTQEQWDEIYFYTFEKNDKGESVEKKLPKSDCIPAETQIHLNYKP